MTASLDSFTLHIDEDTQRLPIAVTVTGTVVTLEQRDGAGVEITGHITMSRDQFNLLVDAVDKAESLSRHLAGGD